MPYAVQALTHYQAYPERPPGADQPPKKVCNLDLMAPFPSERGPSAPVPSIVDENWAGVDMMYYMDGRRHRQSLVYFGEPQDLVI